MNSFDENSLAEEIEKLGKLVLLLKNEIIV